MKSKAGWLAAGLVLAGVSVTPAHRVLAQDAASAPTPDVYTQADLMGMEAALAAKADPKTGLATKSVKKYASDYTLLGYRNKSGQAEQHAKFADFYIVVEGKATLVSGGQMVGGASTGEGELKGDSITGGKEVSLKKGDIVHIPANIPHQLVLAKGDTLKYFIVKVQEVQ